MHNFPFPQAVERADIKPAHAKKIRGQFEKAQADMSAIAGLLTEFQKKVDPKVAYSSINVGNKPESYFYEYKKEVFGSHSLKMTLTDAATGKPIQVPYWSESDRQAIDISVSQLPRVDATAEIKFSISAGKSEWSLFYPGEGQKVFPTAKSMAHGLESVLKRQIGEDAVRKTAIKFKL